MQRQPMSHMLAATVVVLLVLSPVLHAQPYTQIHNFDCLNDGCNPNMPSLLAQGEDGSLYGTMPFQTFGWGTFVRYTPGGTFNNLHSFTSSEAFGPQSGVTLGLDGNFYGSSSNGGGPGFGTIYKVTPAGAVTVLYTFTNGTDGARPWAPPIQHPNGNLYGPTYNGSTPGTVYQIKNGVFSIIATLPSKTQAPFILGTDGNMYGTTPLGGQFNAGTVFKLTTAGKVTIIHNFNPSVEGSNPGGPVFQAADGYLYGVSVWGGQFGQGIVYKLSTGGGGYKVLHNFQVIEGSNSTAGLVQGSDNFLYGVSQGGGGSSFGTLFKINTTGTVFTVLYNFTKVSGGNPFATPTLHTNGLIYGLTITGGSITPADGVLYSYDAGLKPFVKLVIITSGKVGTAVGILGQGFSTATGVQFGTGPGTFQVVSDTYMIAKPATGATTGKVTVLEPTGNLSTFQTFKVIPSITSFTPPSGPVGTSVVITGTSLLQTAAVTFGGVKATTVTVNSDTQVTAIVPTGAKTGKIAITTKGGTATSAAIFTVT